MRIILSALFFILMAFALNAQTADIPFGGLKHDNSLPVEITSDSLSLDQATGKAIFEGNVKVGQGTLRLDANKMDVFYIGSNGGSGQIKTIKAYGNVFLSNGTEAAEGNQADYDVDTGLVKMTGDVILTQGQNVLSGKQLTVNLDKGTAQMTGGIKTIFTTGTK